MSIIDILIYINEIKMSRVVYYFHLSALYPWLCIISKLEITCW